MKLLKLISLLLVALLSAIAPTHAFANLAQDLSDGRHILLMRHADAPGFGDPKGYQLNQCATQRNLGEAGKRQSQIIGQWLKSQGISNARVFSSPWCRCLDTAKLLNLGPVTTAPELGSFFDDMSQAKRQTDELVKLIAAERKQNPNMPIIMVTHHVNIQSYVGVVINSGDMVLVKVDPTGKPVSFKLYPSP